MTNAAPTTPEARPRSFTDREGVTWHVNVTAAAFKRVRDLTGINLYGLVEGKTDVIETLGSDIVALAETLYAVCKPQADGLGLTLEQFLERLNDGQMAASAGDALLDGVVAFSRSPKVQAAIRAVLDKQDAARKRLEDATAEYLTSEGLSAEIDAAVEQALKPLLAPSARSTGSPGSAGSTPAP